MTPAGLNKKNPGQTEFSPSGVINFQIRSTHRMNASKAKKEASEKKLFLCGISVHLNLPVIIFHF